MKERQGYYNIENVYSSLVRNEMVYYRALFYAKARGGNLTEDDFPFCAVLGGFNPRSGIAEKFEGFINNIHPEAENKIILDSQAEPFELMGENKLDKLRGNLRNLPFKDGVVDMMILDYTTEFLSDESLVEASREFNRVLKKNGLVILTIDPPLIPLISAVTRSAANKTRLYPRSETKTSYLMKPLKPVLIAEYDALRRSESIIVMAKEESDYERFEGSPFYFSKNALANTPKKLL